MKKVVLASLLGLAIPFSASFAAAPSKENSMDAPRRGKRAPSLPNMAEAALSPTNAEVGDGDSFGRSVNFLGYAQTNGVSIWDDCTGQIEGTCVVPDPQFHSGSIVRIGDEAVIHLPPRAARSLLCFTAHPIGYAQFLNSSATRQTARFSMGVRFRIESEVLNDPALINQGTGLPFNGVIEGGMPLAGEFFSLEPGAERGIDVYAPRSCNSGHLSRRGLMEMGLTDAQAREVFRKPLTLRFGAGMSVSWGVAAMNPGIRVYGD